MGSFVGVSLVAVTSCGVAESLEALALWLGVVWQLSLCSLGGSRIHFLLHSKACREI